MFECKACGGALRFDIASQQMLCPYCEEKYDPGLFQDQGSAEETEYETTIFTCPQCGGELGATETSSAEFCSFCGAPTILESRLSRLQKPKYIIPFKKTKEESKKELQNHLNKLFYIPKDFKDSEVESFRGIYMPTWNYNILQKGKVSLKYETNPETDPEYVYQYRIDGDVDAAYRGIPHDASESFADRISESLEPYTYKERLDFNPAYMAGYFSDIQDVSSSTYEKDAMELVAENTYNQLKSRIHFEDGGTLTEPEKGRFAKTIPTTLEGTDNTLVPVWFLSYRKGKRIAYATVNGETGKVITDTPISIGKVWLLAILLAVPIFFILNMFVSMVASTLLFLASSLLCFTGIIYYIEMEQIIKREKNINFERAKREASKKIKPEEKKKKARKFSLKTCGVIAIIVLLFPIICGLGLLALGVTGAVLFLIIYGLTLVIPIYSYFHLKGEIFVKKIDFLLSFIAGFISLGVFLTNPVSDLSYYGATVIDFVVILLLLTNIWKALNILTTRPLPQFRTRGGDNYEK